RARANDCLPRPYERMGSRLPESVTGASRHNSQESDGARADRGVFSSGPVSRGARGPTVVGSGRTEVRFRMAGNASTQRSGNVFADLGIPAPDVELAKADLAIRIQRLAELRHLSADEAAALLNVPTSELSLLFQGRLATCSL